MGFNICQWTAERIAILRRLWVTGMPASKIAKAMGNVTRSGVIGKAHRLGIAEQHYDNGKPKLKRKHRKVRPVAPPMLEVVMQPLEAVRLPADTSPTECTIMQLGPHSCRWPLSDDTAHMLYCGAQIWSGSYCQRHARVAWKSGGRV